MRIYNAVFGGYDLKHRWRTYEYLIRAEDSDEAAGAFGHEWWHHGLGETAISATSAPEIALVGDEAPEFPADHRVQCTSHPNIHVGWSCFVAVPDPFGFGGGIPTRNGRPEVKLSFGRHSAATCWMATDAQKQKITEVDAWTLWAHFGMQRTGHMTEHSLRAFGLIPEVQG